MAALAALTLTLSLLLAWLGARAGNSLPPRAATWMLTAGCLVSALATGFVLSTAAAVTLGRLPDVADDAGWSAADLGAGNPLPPVAGLLPAAVVLGLLGAAIWRTARHVRDLTTAHRACHRLGPGVGGLVVVDDTVPDAYTLAGFPGRVVVSTAMLRALSPAEGRALLAHEDSHLRHRHHLYVQAADVAAAANPLLRRAARAVRLATERWADEDAAAAAGRTTTATALARASLAAHAAAARPAASCALTRVGVVERVQALTAGPPPPRPARVGVAAGLVLATALAAWSAAHAVEDRFERAQVAYQQEVGR